MSGMMKQGTDHTLGEDDLWELPEKDQAEGLTGKLEMYWSQQLMKKR